MKTHLTFLFTFMLLLSMQHMYAQPTAPLGKKWIPVEKLTDEFNGETLDATKWDDYHPNWSGRAPSQFLKGNAFVENGKLLLRSTLKQDPSTVDDPFSDIWVNSAACVSKGWDAKPGYYYEASIKASSLSMTSSFWFRVGDYSEIDVIEHIGNPSVESRQDDLPYEYHANTHYYGEYAGLSSLAASYDMSTRGRDEYHIFGFWWKDANTLWFYHNGEKVMEIIPRVPLEENLKLIFDTEVFPFATAGVANIGLPLVENLNDTSKNTMYVDYLRTYELVEGEVIPVSDISVSPVQATIEVNDKITLAPAFSPSDASDKSVTWNSSNTSIATVNGGVVTGVGTGTATITVTSVDGGFSASSTVTVTPSTKTEFTFNPTNDAYLQGTIPFNTTDLRVESGNRVSYLMFDLSGVSGDIASAELILGVGSDAGSGEVTVSLGGSNNWTETTLSSTNAPATGTQLSTQNTTYAKGSTYTWTLDESALSAGGSLSLVVTHVSGNDVSFASKENSNATLIPVLKVSTETGAIIVESVSLDADTKSLTVGESFTIAETVLPVDADNKSVVWSSSDDAIATVVNGVVTAIAAGSTTITVTTVDGDKTDICNVTVNPVVTEEASITVDDNSKYLTTEYQVDGTMEVVINYNAGSGNTVTDALGGVQVMLRECTSAWAVVNDYVAADASAIGLQSGTATVNIDLTGVTATADLPDGNFYFLFPRFTSSNGNTYSVNGLVPIQIVGASTPIEAIVIEAESLTSTTGTYNDGNVPLGVNVVANLGINWVNSGDEAVYTFEVLEDGEYDITYFISTPMDNAQIQLSIDGTVISTDNVTNNGQWDTYYGLNAANNVTLTAGTHTATVEATGSNTWQWNLDKIVLSPIGIQKKTLLNINPDKTEICLYPNPATDVINIQLSTDANNASVVIYNITGIVVISENIDRSLFSLSVNYLSAGIYIIQVNNGSDIILKQFVIE